MSENISPWVNLAARLIRVVLARKDVTYGELVLRLQKYGHKEKEKALASRVAIGRVRLSMLLQILYATHAELPALWNLNFDSEESWESRAQRVIRLEFAQSPIRNKDEILSKLVGLGAGFSEKTLAGYLDSGALFLPVFLRLLFVLRSPSLNSFLDQKDIIAAASSEVAVEESSG
ncbi:hypothetical protein Hrubri_4351 [Herbaspirillum rubrisubalbicans M1]|uniref:DUF6471 domain-containing protein n=1 Tax=Herbaspirillum rubrisubalbicans TaxID=80842 RepID=UPI00073ABF28|nr:DUF6471 domain-containing protein [Herbaspirillum rubrisubalbicans]ALU91496.1 hypothetical protein Hrubri_4351 [Herbaspirillum rubrisubalbicans M1]